MARQSLIAAFLVAAACRQIEPYTGAFDVPIAIGVLQPEDGGPFKEPIGFVANQHGGQIVPLALKQGRFLTDDATASFLRTNPIPTGALRLLTSVAATSRGVDEVTLWAGDARFGTLLRLPWILDCAQEGTRPECVNAPDTGAPVEQGLFRDVVSGPEGLVLEDVSGKRGYTATETWTITYDGSVWWVEGSRSGPQPTPATTGVPWDTDLHRLAFRILDPDDRAVAGDVFTVNTRSGASEIDVGGTPNRLLTSPDQRTLAMVVTPEDPGALPFVAWFDTESRRVTRVALAPDASPGRITFTEDGLLLVTDLARPAVWEIAPGAAVGLEHVLPWPVLDVAELGGTLFVTPEDGRSLWRIDRATDEVLDVNVAAEGLQGIELTANVVGMEAIRTPYQMPEFSDEGIRRIDRAVGVSLSSGAVVFVHEDTGCLVQSSLGPRTVYDPNSPNIDYSSTFDDAVGGAELEANGSSTRHVVVNDCGGIAVAESWTLRYDEVRQGWTVTGSFSGEQSTLAYEDERYVSDLGEISFVIRAGSLPSRDGWVIGFVIDSGLAAAIVSSDTNLLRQVSIGVSGDLTSAVWRAGLSGPIGDFDGVGWYPVDVRTVLLSPGAASNEVARVDPQTSVIDVGWE